MSEKHDAMWGAAPGEYIVQQEAEIVRLRAALEEIAAITILPVNGYQKMAVQIARAALAKTKTYSTA